MNTSHSLSISASGVVEFTDDEIREQLRCLGFKNISDDKFRRFKKGMSAFN
jgi:hypothetical protein